MRRTIFRTSAPARVGSRRRTRAFLFATDAMFAAMLLVLGVVLISRSVGEARSTAQESMLSTDVMTVLSTVTVRELDDPWVDMLISNGTLDDPDTSVLVTIGRLWALNETAVSQNLSALALGRLVPSSFSFTFTLEDERLANATGLHDLDRVDTPSRRMISGVAKGQALEGSSGSALLKRIRNKRTAVYAYFGGFVGQGRITVRLDGLPADINATNVDELFLEGEYDSDFDLRINGVFCLSVDPAPDIIRVNATSCSSLLIPENNTVTLDFTEGFTNASVSGGLLGVTYRTSEFNQWSPSNQTRAYLPDIDGIINLYDGFMVPGTLVRMSLTLHYWVTENSTIPIFFDIGNTTVFTLNTTGEHSYTFDNTYLDAFLDYAALSDTTVPYRFGFSSGNNTNTSGNLTDAFLLTSRHYTMGMDDIPIDATTNMTRIALARDVDDLFVDIVLNSTGNRVGLVSFGTGASVALDSALATNAVTLHTAIAGYAPHSAEAQRNLCGAMETAKAQLLAAGSGRRRAILLMTDGDLMKKHPITGADENTALCAGSNSKFKAVVWADAVRQACNFTDAVHGNPQKITFYTVAFGPQASSDPTIVANLTLMANCTGGKFASGNNASELSRIYQEFASELAQSSIAYEFQRATLAENVESRLYGDSSLLLEYVPDEIAEQQSQITFTMQTGQFGSCTPTVTIPPGLVVMASHVVSYSGDFWTKRLAVDGTVVYDLSPYASNFSELGDPYRVYVPPGLLTAGDHTFSLALGSNDSVDVPCSFNDSLIYTVGVNASTRRSPVLEGLAGCVWEVEYEDGTRSNLSIPTGVSSANRCSYTNANITYDPRDAYQLPVYELFRSLDFDNDGRVIVNLEEADLQVIVSVVSRVPYLWGPSIAQVVVGR